MTTNSVGEIVIGDILGQASAGLQSAIAVAPQNGQATGLLHHTNSAAAVTLSQLQAMQDGVVGAAGSMQMTMSTQTIGGLKNEGHGLSSVQSGKLPPMSSIQRSGYNTRQLTPLLTAAAQGNAFSHMGQQAGQQIAYQGVAQQSNQVLLASQGQSTGIQHETNSRLPNRVHQSGSSASMQTAAVLHHQQQTTIQRMMRNNQQQQHATQIHAHATSRTVGQLQSGGTTSQHLQHQHQQQQHQQLQQYIDPGILQQLTQVINSQSQQKHHGGDLSLLTQQNTAHHLASPTQQQPTSTLSGQQILPEFTLPLSAISAITSQSPMKLIDTSELQTLVMATRGSGGQVNAVTSGSDMITNTTKPSSSCVNASPNRITEDTLEKLWKRSLGTRLDISREVTQL